MIMNEGNIDEVKKKIFVKNGRGLLTFLIKQYKYHNITKD